MNDVSRVDLSGLAKPLARFGGAVPAAPEWFTHAIAVEPEDKTITVGGAPIHYLRWGDRSRPGLLLVHGNSAHAHWWSFIAPYFARDYNVAAFDLSGMGDSGWRDGYTMEMFAEEELAVCEDAGMFAHAERPIIVGHSFGGFVTMVTGAHHGERLKGAVIIDTPVTADQRHQRSPLKAHARNVYPTLAAALARFRLLPPQDCANPFIIDWIARKSLKPEEGGYVWKFDPAIWREFQRGDTSALLRSMKCPTALMRGEKSILMTADVGDYMLGLLGHRAPLVVIPEAQHHVMLDQPLALVAALRTLFAGWGTR